MVQDVTEQCAIEDLKRRLTDEMAVLHDRGWTIKCYPLNRGGFLLSFDPPDPHDAPKRKG